MNLANIIKNLELTLITDNKDFSEILPAGGYASDMLSCVMAGANSQDIWVTLQSHANIVAVAALLDLSAVIITEGAKPDNETVKKANEENVILLTTPKQNFEITGKLWDLGIRPQGI